MAKKRAARQSRYQAADPEGRDVELLRKWEEKGGRERMGRDVDTRHIRWLISDSADGLCADQITITDPDL
jgi:hypothetical protein